MKALYTWINGPIVARYAAVDLVFCCLPHAASLTRVAAARCEPAIMPTTACWPLL